MNRRRRVIPGVLLMLAVPMAARAQAPTGVSADQQFLRAVADLNSGVALLAHETLHRPGTFPSKVDAEKVDKRHDDEMDHIRAAMKMLSDGYRPKASPADSAVARALGTQTGAAYDRAFRTDVANIDQREAQIVDKYLPQLTNAQIKTLAQRMRDAAVAEAKGMGG